jgi:hypothetical protein
MKLFKKVPPVYSITVAAMTNGTVVPDKSKAAEDETVTLTVTPDAGYRLVAGSLKRDGTVITGETFKMPADDIVITADFEEVFSITVAAMTNGTVVPDKSKAAEGETVTLTVTPDAGYKLVDGSLKYDGTAITGESFEMPDGDVEITADFELVT